MRSPYPLISLFLLPLIGGCSDTEIQPSPDNGHAIQNAGAAADAQPIDEAWTNPLPATRSWVLWYWMESAVSKAGITADLEAMQAAGIGGAYLMPIRGPAKPPVWDPPVNTLTPEWWDCVRHALAEADRLGLQIAMHVGDGFAVAGGPWITPELSMQKVVWTEQHIAVEPAQAGAQTTVRLEQPETYEGWYRDLAVYAFPTYPGAGIDSATRPPRVTTSVPGLEAEFLANGLGEERLRYDSQEPMWIQYSFDEPFTARSLRVKPDGRDFQSRRLLLMASDDGEQFRPVHRFTSPRHGWQDYEQDLTYAIPEVTARHFRFIYDPSGTEPGAEDLDIAKWRNRLRVRGLLLSSEPRINQYEGKNGGIWRISPFTTEEHIGTELAVDKADIQRLTIGADGHATWTPPAAGKWTILRMGHTSTGHTNATGGAGVGLEIDKFRADVAQLQWDNWFGEALRQAGPERAGRVLAGFHVDSWECGSQNWSQDFAAEFERLRGYDPLPFLPAMAGIAVGSADASERFLHDIRTTIGELINENFFEKMASLAHEAGCFFSAEATAPVTVTDGLRHHDIVDIPMGEFWLRSPTHDKPNDTLDGISGAHIYGKRIVAAEAFTQLRIMWDEHPGMIKALGDLHYALGYNRMAYHVFVHNPWMDRQPGMTLGGVGLFFQRDQTWWKPAKAFIDYCRRVQTLLQRGSPVTDIAVFIGEDMPRRAVLPDRLWRSLPGLIGREAFLANQLRMINRGLPTQEEPAGVHSSANSTNAADWVDALRGYKYDSINPDALLRLARVENGRIVLPGGSSYGLLVLPGERPMAPEGGRRMSVAVARKIGELAAAGANIIVNEKPVLGYGPQDDEELARLVERWWPDGWEREREVGEGRVIRGPLGDEDLSRFGIPRDFSAIDENGARFTQAAWTHRRSQAEDIYFISNQSDQQQRLTLSLRATGGAPELWDPLTGDRSAAAEWQREGGQTQLPVELPPHGSLFVVLRDGVERSALPEGRGQSHQAQALLNIDGPWQVAFSPPGSSETFTTEFAELIDWTTHSDPRVQDFAGTARYSRTLTVDAEILNGQRLWLDLGAVDNIAEVLINGQSAGVAWTAPMRVEVTGLLRPGANAIEIAVTNTWHNRLIADQPLPESERSTFLRGPYRLEGRPLQPAGLHGPVRLLAQP